MKKINFNDIDVIVMDCYPFRYPNGRDVLQIKVALSDYNVLKQLGEYTGSIKYYETDAENVWVLKTEYTNYYADFSCNFYDGEWNIEMKRIDKTELELQKTKDALKVTGDALEELLAMVVELGGM